MLSDGSPKRTFCYATDAITGYYKVLVRGHDGEPYNIGIDRPEISMAELARMVSDSCARIVRLPRASRARQGAGSGLSDRQPESSLPEHRQGARAPRLQSARCRWRKACIARSSGTRTIAPRKPPDAHLDRRNRLRRAGDAARVSPSTAMTSPASTSTRPSSRRSTPARAPIHEEGLPEILARNGRSQAQGERAISRAPCTTRT